MKNLKRIVKFVISLFLAIILMPIAALAGILLLGHAVMWMPPYPPLPEITSGEFPFELTYEIDGEITTVNDIYVCEYDGVHCDFNVGKHIVWNERFDSDETKDVIFLTEIDGVELFCTVGWAKYYMGEYDDNYEASPNVYSVQEYKLGGTLTHFFQSEEELYEQYGIRIISYEFSPPIENTFSKNIFCYFPFGPEIYKIIKK